MNPTNRQFLQSVLWKLQDIEQFYGPDCHGEFVAEIEWQANQLVAEIVHPVKIKVNEITI